jgi:hypothetical protein
MTRIFLIFCTLFIAGQLVAQKPGYLHLGAGLPVFTKNMSNLNDEMSTKGLNFSIEKPLYLKIGEYRKFSINPGIAYYHFTEVSLYGSIGALVNSNLKHQSASVFSKFIINDIYSKKIKSRLFLGVQTGYHVYTQTKGIKEYLDANDGLNRSNIDESGEKTFGTYYYGFLLGFAPRPLKPLPLFPRMEFGYYPKFLSPGLKNGDIFQFSLMLSFYSMKK